MSYLSTFVAVLHTFCVISCYTKKSNPVLLYNIHAIVEITTKPVFLQWEFEGLSDKSKKKKWLRHINLNKYWVIGFRLKLKLLFLRKICMRSYKQCTHSFPDKWLFHFHVLFISLTWGGKCGRYFFLLSISITTHRNNFDKLVCRR